MAQRATSLGPRPSSCFCFFCSVFCSFPFFVSLGEKLFSPKKWHFCLVFSVSLCFSLAFCFILPFSLSRSLSLSLSLFSFSFSFFSARFISFFFASFFVFLFLSLVSWLCFMKRTTSKHKILKFVFHQSFLFFGFSVFFFVFNSLFL